MKRVATRAVGEKKSMMTYAAEVELRGVFIRRQKPTKETAEADEDLPLGVSCFPGHR